MFYLIIALAALVVVIAESLDLKKDIWEWTDTQRKTFIIVGAAISVWATKNTPYIWLHATIAVLALLGLLIILRTLWKHHKTFGGGETFGQRVFNCVACAALVWASYSLAAPLLIC